MSWWRHQMEKFSALLTLCAGNSQVTGEFPAQRPVTRSFDVFFDLRLNERLSKQSWGWWFETPSRSLWRHCNVISSLLWRRCNGSPEVPFINMDQFYPQHGLIIMSITNCGMKFLVHYISNCATVEFWEWISNSIPHLTGMWLPIPNWGWNWSMLINWTPGQISFARSIYLF